MGMTSMNAPRYSPAEFESLVLLASEWVIGQEEVVLHQGIPLSESQIADALQVGVSRPERVRLLSIAEIPIPDNAVLRRFCEASKTLSPATKALSARYGILIRSDQWCRRDIIVHELTHTAQYERLGGIRSFLEHYLRECLTIGFPHGSMEQEAITTAARICAES